MPTIDLSMLVARLGPVCRRALEAAAGAALSRTHYNVEVEHWLLQLLDVAHSDVALLLAGTGLDTRRLRVALTERLDRFATGNGRAPSLSPDLVDMVKDAWLLASVEEEQTLVRSGHLLWASLSDEAVAARLRKAAPMLERLVPDLLRRDLARLTADGAEAPAADGVAADAREGAPLAATALGRYTIDLTERARGGRIDPIVGREREVQQVIDILTRRRQNNPILVGEAGVGKTAVAEGLALRIAAGDVPAQFARAAICTLDLGLLQAGAGVKGEFENRLRSVIDETQSGPDPVILFIDEAHTLVGAGGAPGQGDAANLLKPPLARGDLRVIAATTRTEYKRYIEKDAALARRFQAVQIDEPSEPVAMDMVRGLLPALERHHGVRVLDEAVSAAVRLSARHIHDRQLPDKAVSLIDTACARVAMSQSVTPREIDDRHRRLDAAEAEARVLRREAASGARHDARLAVLASETAGLRDALDVLDARWSEERALVETLAALRRDAEATGGDGPQRERAAAAAGRLRLLQDGQPLVFGVVDAQAVAEIVESWTGIPTRRMQASEVEAVLTLPASLSRRVVGQDHALDAVSKAIRVSRAGLTDPRKPVGAFLMVGTSGVGKTETALALADALYGGEASLTVINMSEFKEEHRVSLLTGSPPGYVGYGEGGVLTEAVRRRPHSVLLLDEVEKAHPGVQDVFYQVLDKGTMRDGEGRDIDFRNTVIILTSNAGSALIDRLFADPDSSPDAATLAEALRPEMLKHFKPAFLGRLTLVPYLPLGPDTLRRVVALQFARIARRLRDTSGVALEVSEAAEEAVMRRSHDHASGARSIETLLASAVLPVLSMTLLARMAEGRPVTRVAVDADAAGEICCRFD